MQYNNYLFRCSSLSKITGQCKEAITSLQLATIAKYEAKAGDLTSKQKSEFTKLKNKRDKKLDFDLSVGAKNYCRLLVKKEVLNFTKNISSAAMEKGTICEDDSIELYNWLHLTDYKKNEISLSNEWIKGTCDVHVKGAKIQDFKTSKDKSTFPMLSDEIEVGGYQWQGDGYMFLYGEQKFELVYCLVQTPDELIPDWEDYELHDVEDIEGELRVTTLMFDRCEEREALIKHKVIECRKYMNWYYSQIQSKHG